MTHFLSSTSLSFSVSTLSFVLSVKVFGPGDIAAADRAQRETVFSEC